MGTARKRLGPVGCQPPSRWPAQGCKPGSEHLRNTDTWQQYVSVSAGLANLLRMATNDAFSIHCRHDNDDLMEPKRLPTNEQPRIHTAVDKLLVRMTAWPSRAVRAHGTKNAVTLKHICATTSCSAVLRPSQQTVLPSLRVLVLFPTQPERRRHRPVNM